MSAVTPKSAHERRSNRRYTLRLPIRYRVFERKRKPRTGAGATEEMSSVGLSFHSRRAAPAGAHIEMFIEWPVKREAVYPMYLYATGFVLRSAARTTAVRLSSRKFFIQTPAGPTELSAPL